ncbi:MAG: hypothetical protein WBJ41_08785 [Chromatiaceae bacterium]
MGTLEVRGARDLAELWRGLPAAGLRYALPATEPPPDLAVLSDGLRARAWRDHCADPMPVSCVERGCDCSRANQGGCRADILFPMRLGGGALTWRMATLFLQGWPTTRTLHLIALGETACEELEWAARWLRRWPALGTPERLPVVCFGDLELRAASRFRLRLVTPWVVGKGERGHDQGQAPDAPAVARELMKSLRSRAHKFTALCARDSLWQRLGGHLVHHVADALLPVALVVEAVAIQPVISPPTRSRSNGRMFHELAWLGEVRLSAAPALLPWLTLLALCGGGENADKGKGRVELLPLTDPILDR